MQSTENTEKVRVLALGGGKGGIGKTVLAASLGMGLAMLHKKVVLVDADLGGANLHRVLGMEHVRKSSIHFIQKKVRYLEELMTPHPRFENLNLIRGMNGYLGAANLQYTQKLKLIRHIHQLPADYVIMDLGAGSNYHVLDFFLAANSGIIVVTPDPLSILEAYHFIKQAYFRRLMHLFRTHESVFDIIKRYACEGAQSRHVNVENMLTEIRLTDAAASEKIYNLQGRFHPAMIVNRLRTSADEKSCMAVRTAAGELLSLDIDYWGAVHDDPVIYDALCKSQPFIGYNSKSRASRDLATIIITRLLRRPYRSRQMKEIIKPASGNNNQSVCSFHCQFWETCEFRKGGYPCDLVKI
ncbi:AAA family ATPase [bacterium]|nr:AAA family ATPase [bacterium]